MTQATPPNEPSSLDVAPRSVQLTKSLVWPLLGLHALSAVISIIAMRSQGATEYFRNYLPPAEFEALTPDVLGTMFTAATASFIAFAAINAALFVVVGLGLRANRGWARFLGLVLAVLFLISAAYTLLFATSYGELSGLVFVETIISWVIVLITVWWIVQALNKDTARWFAMHRELQT